MAGVDVEASGVASAVAAVAGPGAGDAARVGPGALGSPGGGGTSSDTRCVSPLPSVTVFDARRVKSPGLKNIDHGVNWLVGYVKNRLPILGALKKRAAAVERFEPEVQKLGSSAFREKVQEYKDLLGLEYLTIFPHLVGDPYTKACEQMERFATEVVPLVK